MLIPSSFWILCDRNVQKRFLKITLASWAALILQTSTDSIRWYCSVMKRHFQRNLHPHSFSCPQNLLVNRSLLPVSGSLGLLIMPPCSWNAQENGSSACLFRLMSTTVLKQSKSCTIFGLKQVHCLIITCSRYQNTRFTSESSAIYLRSATTEVKGADADPPVLLTSCPLTQSYLWSAWTKNEGCTFALTGTC